MREKLEEFEVETETLLRGAKSFAVSQSKNLEGRILFYTM